MSIRADCTLRESVIAANGAGGADTITLAAGSYDLSIQDAESIAAPARGQSETATSWRCAMAAPSRFRSPERSRSVCPRSWRYSRGVASGPFDAAFRSAAGHAEGSSAG